MAAQIPSCHHRTKEICNTYFLSHRFDYSYHVPLYGKFDRIPGTLNLCKGIFTAEAAYVRLEKTFLWWRKNNVVALMRDCAVDVPPPKFALFRELYPCIDVVNPATGILVRFHMFGLFLSNVDVAALVLLIATSLSFHLADCKNSTLHAEHRRMGTMLYLRQFDD